MRERSAFSLVELMIVVAIIGILAAIAIPNFIGMQLRAKRVELNTNVAGIKTAEVAYDAAHDGFVDCGANPATVPGKVAVEWGAAVAGFDTLGWRPDGAVRGQYSVTVSGDGTDFEVVGQSDVDGDGHYADVRASATLDAALQTDNDVF